MSKVSAPHSTNKVMQKCPNCGDGSPKELVAGPKRMNWFGYIFVSFITGGIGLFFFSKFNKSILELYCSSCGESFRSRKIG